MTIQMIDLLPQPGSEVASLEGPESQLLVSPIPAELFASLLNDQFAQGALDQAQRLAESTGDPVLVMLNGQLWSVVTPEGLAGDGETVPGAFDLAQMMSALGNSLALPGLVEGQALLGTGESLAGQGAQPEGANAWGGLPGGAHVQDVAPVTSGPRAVQLEAVAAQAVIQGLVNARAGQLAAQGLQPGASTGQAANTEGVGPEVSQQGLGVTALATELDGSARAPTGPGAGGPSGAVDQGGQLGNGAAGRSGPFGQASAVVTAETQGSARKFLDSFQTLAVRSETRSGVAASTVEPFNAAPGLIPGEGVHANGTAGIDVQSGLPRVERVTVENFGQFAVRSVRHFAGGGEETITVRLIPESLGELRIHVRLGAGELEVRLVSANPLVREALEGQLSALRDAFAREGLDVTRVTVSTNTAWDAASGGQSGRHGASGNPLARQGPQSPGTSPDATMASGPPSALVSVHDGSLDVLA